MENSKISLSNILTCRYRRKTTKTHYQIIGIFLAFSLLVILIEPPLAFADGRLTLKTSHKSVYEGEQITFTGKLTDRNNYAVSGATIIIWETDDGRVQQIGETTTNARGEYRVIIRAQYWDGVGNPVEIYAFSSVGAEKSTTISINIDKPYSNQKFVEVIESVPTVLRLWIDENKEQGTIQLYPGLETTYGNQDLIYSDSISIYFNGEFSQTVSSNEWTSDINITPGSYTINAYFPMTIDKVPYNMASDSIDYTFSAPKKSTTTTTLRTTTNTAQTSNDDLYKNYANNAKLSYWDVISMLDNGIKKSEDSLSGLVFENSDAKQIIENTWDIKWVSLDSLENAKSIMNSGESYLKNGNYEQAYNRMQEVDAHINSINDDFSTIANNIQKAKKLENDYLEQNKFCFLFWCEEVKKFDWVDLRVKDIELQIQKITNKKETLRSDFAEFDIKKTASLQLAKKQQELESEQFAKQKKEQELAQKQRELAYKQEQLELEQLAKEQKQRELVYKQEQLELEQIENDKQSILAKNSWSPFIMGLTDGELTYYVQPLPSYASQDVRNRVENLASWMDGKTMYGGIKLKRVYEYSYSDFSINWVKDYQEEAIGRQVGSYLIIGLGMGNCYGDWMPFNGYTVYKIMWHEVGHALGYAHVSDPNNILYKKGTGNKFNLEYEDSITLPDGYWQQVRLCRGGSFSYSAQTNSQTDGFKVYVVPPDSSPRDIINREASFYLGCSAYENSMISTGDDCSVASGSYLLIYNPSTLGLGNAVTVDLKIYNTNPDKKMDLDFDESNMFFSKDYINYVKTLFRN